MLNLQRKKQYIGRKGTVIVIDTVPYLVRNEAKSGGREEGR